jgi:hypothetical protein
MRIAARWMLSLGAMQSLLSRPLVAKRLLIALLAMHSGLLLYEAGVDGPTLNEPGHLAAGLSIWQTGRFDVYKVNPPLVRMVAALPIAMLGTEFDASEFDGHPGPRPEFQMGERLAEVEGTRFPRLITVARAACIPFSILGGMACYLWARDLYGNAAALISVTLWCFCPNILGHGHLITADVAGSAMAIAAAYSFWLWLRTPTWRRALLSGAILGIAELTKTTLLILYVAWPLLWVCYRLADRSLSGIQSWLREFAMVLARLVLAAYVINAGYGFEGSCTALSAFPFTSGLLSQPSADPAAPNARANRFSSSIIGTLPIPLPRNYVLGIDLQKRDFEHYGRRSYLRGSFSSRGWWYYYIYAMAIKVPLGTWVILTFATFRKPNREIVNLRDEAILVTPALVVFIFVSSQTGFSEHMRYVLPVLPFMFVWAGRIALDSRPQRIRSLGVAMALIWTATSSLWIFPHSISYFNEAVCGPRNGARHLLNSNIDWGQDLLELRHWQDTRHIQRPFRLAAFGYFEPESIGVTYDSMEPVLLQDPTLDVIPPGTYAVSANFVYGYPHFIYLGNGSKTYLPAHALSRFRLLRPSALVGYSIYIYEVAKKSDRGR